MEIDWRITKTFKLIFKEKKKLDLIDSIELRRFYIVATGNQSKTSFSDFVERLKALSFLEQQEEGELNKFKILPAIWDVVQ